MSLKNELLTQHTHSPPKEQLGGRVFFLNWHRFEKGFRITEWIETSEKKIHVIWLPVACATAVTS